VSPFKTYIVKVLKYDFGTDEGEYQPSQNEWKRLHRPMVVQAATEEEAISKVSDRTGWCILEAEFMN
jgi:hypothetical protein